MITAYIYIITDMHIYINMPISIILWCWHQYVRNIYFITKWQEFLYHFLKWKPIFLNSCLLYSRSDIILKSLTTVSFFLIMMMWFPPHLHSSKMREREELRGGYICLFNTKDILSLYDVDWMWNHPETLATFKDRF